MEGASFDILRIANKEIRNFIDEASSQPGKAVESRWAIRRLEKVAKRIQQAGKVLDQKRPFLGRTPTEAEFLEYAETLRKLGALLEGLQHSLLVERSQLGNIRANLECASSWAASLRELS